MRDTRRALLALARGLELDFAREYVKLINSIKSNSQLDLMLAAIQAGRPDDVAKILQINPETFTVLDEKVREAFLTGAAYQIDSLPKKIVDPETGVRLVVRFVGSQIRAQEIINNIGAELVTEMVKGQQEMIQDVIMEGLGAGRGADQIALDLVGRIDGNGSRNGGVIGLTTKQATTVQRARQGLSNGQESIMRAYLKLKSRDKRYDRRVKESLKTGEQLSSDEVEVIVRRLSNRILRRRGQTIARTEVIKSLNAARREAIQQLIDRGAVSQEQVTRVWDATGDARTRPDHVQMDEQKVAWNQPFITPDGFQLMGPADSTLGAPGHQTINCRCYEDIQIDFLAGAT